MNPGHLEDNLPSPFKTFLDEKDRIKIETKPGPNNGSTITVTINTEGIQPRIVEQLRKSVIPHGYDIRSWIDHEICFERINIPGSEVQAPR